MLKRKNKKSRLAAERAEKRQNAIGRLIKRMRSGPKLVSADYSIDNGREYIILHTRPTSVCDSGRTVRIELTGMSAAAINKLG